MSTTSPDAPTPGGGVGRRERYEVPGGEAPRSGEAGSVARGRRPGPGERKRPSLRPLAIVVYLVLAYLVFVRPGVRARTTCLPALVPAAVLALCARTSARACRRAARLAVPGVGRLRAW